MKKSTIWILGIVMGLSFLSLIYLQVSYIEEMVKMRREHFNESVNRSLEQACRSIELVETKKYLDADAEAIERAAHLSEEKSGEGHVGEEELVEYIRYKQSSSGGISHFEWEMEVRPKVPKPIISTGKDIPSTSKAMRDSKYGIYIYQLELLD